MNSKNIKTPSEEVLDLLKSEMTDSATLKLIKVVKELEQYFGLEITDLISNIDDFISHFHTNELMKRDIKERIEYFQNNKTGSTADDLLSFVKEECKTYDLESECLNAQLFAMRMLKKFISDIAVVFALNQPVYDRKREEINKKHNINS